MTVAPFFARAQDFRRVCDEQLLPLLFTLPEISPFPPFAKTARRAVTGTALAGSESCDIEESKLESGGMGNESS